MHVEILAQGAAPRRQGRSLRTFAKGEEPPCLQVRGGAGRLVPGTPPSSGSWLAGLVPWGPVRQGAASGTPGPLLAPRSPHLMLEL